MHLSHLFIAACVLPQTAALVGIRPSPATRRSAAASDAADAATSIAAAAIAANKNDDDAKIKAIAGPALLGTLADPLLSVVDTAWVSRLGTTALGAVAASSEIFTLVIAVSLALREAVLSVELEFGSDNGIFAPAVKGERCFGEDECAGIRNSRALVSVDADIECSHTIGTAPKRCTEGTRGIDRGR